MSYREEHKKLTTKTAKARVLTENELCSYKTHIESLCTAKGIDPDSYPDTYKSIRDDIFGQQKKPSAKFICELRNKYYPRRRRNKEHLDKILSYSPNSILNASAEKVSEDDIYIVHKRLVEYNNNDDIPKGRIEAEKAFVTFQYKTPIITDVLKFSMRVSWWLRIRQIIDLCNIEPSDELKTIFELHLAECEIKEAYQNRSEKELFISKLEKAQLHLAKVPVVYQNSENYYYWVGRWYLEYWWITIQTNNKSKLRLALDNLCKAMEVAQSKKWWLLSYVCIIKKSLKQKFTEELNSFKIAINKRREKHPLLVSAKIYSITYQILEDYYTKKTGLNCCSTR